MRRLLAFVCTIVFVDTLFYAAITPILPELSDEYGLSKTAAGVLAAAYPAGTFIGALMLELKPRSGVPTRVRLGLAAPSSDATHLRGLLEERLASLILPAPVIGVKLRSGTLRPTQAVSVRLPYAPATAATRALMPDALPRLIERLQARLGRAAVFGLTTHAAHRPELAWRAVAFYAGAAPSQAPVSAPRLRRASSD